MVAIKRAGADDTRNTVATQRVDAADIRKTATI